MMNKRLSKVSFRIIISIFIISGIVLSGTGVLKERMSNIGLRKLSQSNNEYLNSSFNNTLKTFGVLSAIKVGMAIVEGTEIGVGFGLEIGDAVQAAYDYVNLAWKTVLTSAAVILATRYLLDITNLIDQWFLSITLILIYLLLLSRWFLTGYYQIHRILQDVGLLMTVITISVYIILPLSVAGGRLLSEQITAPSITEAESGFSNMNADLFPQVPQEEDGIWSKVTNFKGQIMKIIVYLSKKTTELSVWVLKLIAGYIFDCIVFPLLLFVFLLWFTKLIAKYFFNVKREHIFKKDLEKILSKYYSGKLSF
jgi:hypothetical protein